MSRRNGKATVRAAHAGSLWWIRPGERDESATDQPVAPQGVQDGETLQNFTPEDHEAKVEANRIRYAHWLAAHEHR